MIRNEDIENYIIRYGAHYDAIKENFWVIDEEEYGGAKIVIYHDPPTITFRVKLMKIPQNNREELFRKLLEFNASEMVSGAYGIEGENIVVVETLQSENLDYNEFEAAIDSIEFALTNHYAILQKYRDQQN